jgi:hypothetical protein
MTALGNRVILCNVEERIMERLERTGLLEIMGPENVFPAEDIIGASIWKALDSAKETMGKDEEE